MGGPAEVRTMVNVEPLYGAGPIRRERRSAARIDQLDRQLIDVLDEDQPQSVRHLFYRMTDPRLPEPVEKSERGYRHVQHRMVQLRRSGRLPFGWITDATRRGHYTPTYGDKGDFLRSVKGLYRADLWRWSDVYVEVWTESRSIAGVVEADCRDLAVSLYPAGGFASLSLAYQAAELINHAAAGRQAVILYIGDYDPAGILIDVAIERELRAHLSPDIPLTFDRIAITAEQIAALDLPTKPRKLSDRRALHIRETVEAEAMPARILRQLLRDRIESYLPDRALAVARVEEQDVQDYFDRLATMLAGGS